MTLDELIKQALSLRADGAPGAAPVLLMTPAGIVPVAALGDSLGFANPDGGGPATVILVLPKLDTDGQSAGVARLLGAGTGP